MKSIWIVGAVLLLGAATLSAQTSFIGAGPTYSLPQGKFDSTNAPAIGGTFLFASRKFCKLWTGIRLNYTVHVRRDTTIKTFYEGSLVLSPEARYFFSEPMSFPLYVQGMVHLSGIGGTDSASRSGVGLGGGLGYLLFYDSNCCNWFLDLYAQYQVPNLIFRAADRPALSSIVLGLSFNFGL